MHGAEPRELTETIETTAVNPTTQATPTQPTPGEPPSAKRFHLPKLYVICTGLLLIVPLILTLIVGIRIPQIEREAFANLNAISRLNAGQIESWIDERDANLGFIANNPLFVEHIAEWQTTSDEALRQMLLNNLSAIRSTYDYVAIQVLDTQGRVITESNKQAHQIISEDEIKKLLPAAATGIGVKHSKLIRCSEGDPVMGFVTALFREQDREKVLTGFVVTFASLTQYSFPNIEQWPTASQSGENLLVQRDQDDALYLSRVRHKDAPPLSMRVPLSQTEMPAVRAILDNKAGEMKGKDYRNEPVLAAYRPIGGTSWYLITKIDRSEILAPLWETVLWLTPVALIAVLIIMWAMLALWRQQEKTQRYYLQAEQSRSNQIEQNFFNMPFIGMIIVDPQTRRFLKINEQTCVLTGYSREELRHVTWQELTHPDDLQDAYDQIKRVVRGEIDTAAFEQRIIRKDGSTV